MLSSSNLKSGQASSYFEQDDYYSEEEGPGGSRWLGKGAEQLELEGGVDQAQFTQILRGRSPKGDELFSRKVDQKKRRAATDFTFSAPKSVSVAGLVQGDGRVIDAHHLAVERTLAILEERYAETRVMTANGRRVVGTGNIIAAVFAHGTSREAEPQLHSHCVVMNATQIENGRWYGLLNDSAIANKKLLGQIYQNELAYELKQLGYKIEQREHGQFDIKGYSDALLQTFSTRRGQIEELVAEWKESGRIVRDADGNAINSEVLIREAANLKTRKVKPQVTEAGNLLKNWNAVLAMKGLELPPIPEAEPNADSATHAKTPIEQTRPTPAAPKEKTVIDDGIAHCGERDAIFKRSLIEKFAIEHNIGQQSFVAMQRDINAHSELIAVKKDKKGREQVTTETALHRELATIRLMQQAQNSVEAIATTDSVEQSFEGSTLSVEQRQAIATSCATTDRIIGWQGSAGAGKTFALNSFRQIAEAQGYRVSGYAPSAAAAHELGESLRIETNTVARLLVSEPFHTEEDRKPQVWFVDEAGLLSMKDARALLEKADEEKARVVLVGDTKQLSAVEAGNPFRSLQAAGMLTAHLDETRRQQREDLRQAVQLISRGAVAEGIDVLAAGGCIQLVEEDDSRATQLVNDYLQLTVEERAQTLVLAGTNENRLTLTEQIRQGLQHEGALGKDVYQMKSLQRKDLTVAQGRYAKSYGLGDVIVPIQNYKRLGIEKNIAYVVTGVDVDTNTLTLETPNQPVRQIDPSQCERKATYTVRAEAISTGEKLKWTKNNRVENTRNGQQFTVAGITPTGAAQIIDELGNQRVVDLSGYQHIDYAWVSTTYGSQGKTADHVLALMDKATNKEAFYVATSRAKHQLSLYTDSVEALRKRSDSSRANQNVSDYIPLFKVVNHESTAGTTADNPRSTARHAGGRLDQGQRAASSADPDSGQANLRAGVLAAEYVAEFSGVPEAVEGHLERREVRCWAEEDAARINLSAQQIERTAGRITQLNRQLEHEVRRRVESARRQLARRRRVEQSKLETTRRSPDLTLSSYGPIEPPLVAPPPSPPLPTYEPVELKPRSPAPEQKAEVGSIREDAEPKIQPSAQKPVLEDEPAHRKRWRKYAKGVSAPPGKNRDFQIARHALADGLTKKAVMELLARNSSVSKKLFLEKGSTPAYNYGSSVVGAAMRTNQQQQRAKSKGIER